jgi:hypothetical protein
MSPRVVPFTLLRHLVPPLIGGACGLVAWWVVIVLTGWRRSNALAAGAAEPMRAEVEGVLLLAVLAGAVAVGQILLEGRFERTGRRRRYGAALFAGFVATSCTATSARVHLALSESTLRADTATYSLAWHVLPWMLAGGCAGLALVLVREGRYLVEWAQRRWELRVFAPPPPNDLGHGVTSALHLLGGPLAGLAGALVWYSVGVWRGGHFFASAAGCWTVGVVLGALVWAVPDRLYRGWVRVLVGSRPGWRVPVDHAQAGLRERFVGHFPVGMDLHLPDSDGVAELHVSVVARAPGRWASRGLTRAGVKVRRPLEWMELTYDPTLPAPLEAPLLTGDRIELGPSAELEFVVLPREAE